jgi:hypothetical protein
MKGLMHQVIVVMIMVSVDSSFGCTWHRFLLAYAVVSEVVLEWAGWNR